MALLVTANAKVWAASACALYAKCLVTTTIQGGKAFESGSRPPEDARLSVAKNYEGVKQTYGLDEPLLATGSQEARAKAQVARETDHRWRRIVANDMETIPIALLVFGAGVLTDANAAVHLATVSTFTACRFAHTYAYANSMQPARGLLWTLAHVAVLVGAGNAVVTGILGH